jgi:hypothetical protein
LTDSDIYSRVRVTNTEEGRCTKSGYVLIAEQRVKQIGGWSFMPKQDAELDFRLSRMSKP